MNVLAQLVLTPKGYGTMQRHARFAIAIVAIALATGARSDIRAALLISTLGQSTNGGDPFDNNATATRHALDFLTGSAATVVTKLTIQARNGDLSAAHTLFAEVWSNNAGNPGSLLNSFDTNIIVPASSGPTTYVATDAGILLDPNTIYWLVLRQGEPRQFPGFSMRVDITSGQDVNAGGLYSGVAATPQRISFDSGATWASNGDFTPIYQLEGVAVPEPSTFLMFSSVIGLMALARAANQTG